MPHSIALNLSALPDGIQNKGSFSRPHISLTDPQYKAHRDEINNATRYTLINAIGSNTLEDGKYLYNPPHSGLRSSGYKASASEKGRSPAGQTHGYCHQRHPLRAACPGGL